MRLEPLSFRGNDLASLFGGIRCLGRPLLAGGLLLNLAGHALLDHKGVHINVGLESSTVRGVAQTVVLEPLFGLPVFFLFDHDLLVALNRFFGCEVALLNLLDPVLVQEFELLKLGPLHLSYGTLVVGHSRLQGLGVVVDAIVGGSLCRGQVMLGAHII